MAYTKFKNLPLYLEWAPDNSFTSLNTSKKSSITSVKSDNESKHEQKVTDELKIESENSTNEKIAKKDVDDDDDDDDDEPEPDTTLFVKNLNFSTTDEELKKVHFSEVDTKFIHFKFK